jgi:hypothetical protein
MRIFRIEDSLSGFGPFSLKNSHNAIVDDIYKCGCVSMLQLWRWFGRWIKTLNNAELQEWHFVIYEVENEHVMVGKRQVIFASSQASVVERKSLHFLRRLDVRTISC